MYKGYFSDDVWVKRKTDINVVASKQTVYLYKYLRRV